MIDFGSRKECRMDIEEDIKKLNKYIELVIDENYCDCNELNVIIGKHCDGSKNVAYAIKNILAEREEDKKKIYELEEHQRKFYSGELYTAKQLKQLEENQKKYFINKQKVKEGLEDIEDYFDRLNGPDEDMEYIRNKKKELLEDK